VVQVVERLPSNHKALSSNTSSAKKKKKRRKKEKKIQNAPKSELFYFIFGSTGC
jgi:hypothetical protein